jgi:hypothetical protein
MSTVDDLDATIKGWRTGAWLALGSLGVVAALSWQPLTLMLDTLLRWTNVSMGMSQVALVSCAAGSCVMITTAASGYKPAVTRRIAIAQYRIAAVIAAVSLMMFFAAGQQPEMAPQEYLKRNLGLSWLLPLLYVLLALTLMLWAGMRYSSRSRRGRALFIFTVGIVLIVLASAFLFLSAIGNTEFVGVGAAVTLLACRGDRRGGATAVGRLASCCRACWCCHLMRRATRRALRGALYCARGVPRLPVAGRDPLGASRIGPNGFDLGAENL